MVIPRINPELECLMLINLRTTYTIPTNIIENAIKMLTYTGVGNSLLLYATNLTIEDSTTITAVTIRIKINADLLVIVLGKLSIIYHASRGLLSQRHFILVSI